MDITLMSANMRFVAVHYHIFKNAGSTVERILEREFPGAFARLHGSTPDATLDAEDLAAFLQDHPGVRAVTSHHLRYPAPVIRNAVIFDCCFLRHPLERLDSLYSYFRRIDSTDPLCRSARRQTPAEFMQALIGRAPHFVSNVQVTYLASRGAFTRPAGEDDLERAAAMVRQMALPGVVEMFDESMVAGEHFLRPAFPSLCLSSHAVNVSRRAMADPEEREQRLIGRWGAELYGELTRLNRLDLRLVETAGEEISRRLSFIPGVRGRLSEFGARSRDREMAASVG
jgi:hypothetical protein